MTTFTDETEFDTIEFHQDHSTTTGLFELSYISLKKDGREVHGWLAPLVGQSISSLSHPDTRRLYRRYHAPGQSFNINFGRRSIDVLSHHERVNSPYLKLIPLFNPHLEGTTSLERLQEVMDYADDNTGPYPTNAALRAGGIEHLKYWHAWVTHNVALGLDHDNRDGTRWNLVRQNMNVSVDNFLDNHNMSKWASEFEAIDKGTYPNFDTKYYRVGTLDRDDLGINANDPLPTRLTGPILADGVAGNPVIRNKQHLAHARARVLMHKPIVFDDDMLGPLPSPPAEEEDETSTETE